MLRITDAKGNTVYTNAELELIQGGLCDPSNPDYRPEWGGYMTVWYDIGKQDESLAGHALDFMDTPIHIETV